MRAVSFQVDDFGVVDETVDRGGVHHWSPKVSPQGEESAGGDDHRCPFVAGGDELEEEVGGSGFQGYAAEREFCLQASLGVGVAQPRHQFGGGGEGHPVAGLTGSDPHGGGEVGFTGAGRARKITLSRAATKSRVPEMGDGVLRRLS